MAEKLNLKELSPLEKMVAMDYFEEIVVQAGSTRVVVVKVPGGYLYNGAFAWFDNDLRADLGLIEIND